MPIVFLTYYNPILAFGLKAFCRAAAEAGADGVLVADLPPEEAGPLARRGGRGRPGPDPLRRAHLDARAHAQDRAGEPAASSTWCRSPASPASARELPPDLMQHFRALRTMTTKPICVGFGIATPEHAALVGRIADGVIVGSAIVSLVERHAGLARPRRRGRRLHRRPESPFAPQDADKGPSASLARGAASPSTYRKYASRLPRAPPRIWTLLASCSVCGHGLGEHLGRWRVRAPTLPAQSGALEETS